MRAAALFDEPRERAFDQPAFGQDLESWRGGTATHDVQVEPAPGTQGFDPGDPGSGVTPIGPNLGQPTVVEEEPPQQGFGAVSILFVGRADIDPQPQPQSATRMCRLRPEVFFPAS